MGDKDRRDRWDGFVFVKESYTQHHWGPTRFHVDLGVRDSGVHRDWAPPSGTIPHHPEGAAKPALCWAMTFGPRDVQQYSSELVTSSAELGPPVLLPPAVSSRLRSAPSRTPFASSALLGTCSTYSREKRPTGQPTDRRDPQSRVPNPTSCCAWGDSTIATV